MMSDVSAPPVDPELLAFAVEIVREAGAYTLEIWRSEEFHVQRKGDGTPVTEADLGAERLLRDRIHAKFPDDEILGEEHGDTAGTSGRRWVIDPIDGTYSFTHGVALYSNLLYLEDEHGPAIGVINVPAIGELGAAGRGLGATFNGMPCRVNEHPDRRGGPGLVERVRLVGAGAAREGAPVGDAHAHLGRRLRLPPGGDRAGRGDGRSRRRASGTSPRAR